MTTRAPDYRDRGYGFRKQSDVPAKERAEAEKRGQERHALARPLAKSVSPAERTPRTLEECEAEIQSSFARVAAAFAIIKEKRLYLETGCATFEDYCRERWNITRQHGYRLALAGETINSLPVECNQLVTSEAVARELAAVPQEQRVEVIKTASKAGRVTAKAIRKASAPPVIDVEPEAKPTVKHCATCTCEAGTTKP